jgi:hypothetical protein
MDAADIERIVRAQVCLQKARAESCEADTSTVACELMYHLDMVLRVITSIRIVSGELDDVELVLTPRARALASRTSEPCSRVS